MPEHRGGRSGDVSRPTQARVTMRRRAPVGPGRRQHVGAHAHGLDERELSALGHAHSSPSSAARRAIDLEGGDETLQPLASSRGRSSSGYFRRERIHARLPGEFILGDPGQSIVERRGQIVAHVQGTAATTKKLSSSHSAAGDGGSRRGRLQRDRNRPCAERADPS